MTWGLDDVRVTRGRAIALDGVTVPAEPGRVTVVVGGDGAGKSTSLAVLVGLLKPDAGAAGRPRKERIGYVPATAGVFADLTVGENLDFTARAYQLPGGERARITQYMIERTGLAPARHRLAGHLSGGMRRKLAVGMALLHSPELLVIDEPTTGVDPVSRVELWRLITGAATDGTAVVASTTYVNEAARAASVVLLDAGRVLASGSPDDILRGVPGAVGTVSGRSVSGDSVTGTVRPAPPCWRRGPNWRVWAQDGLLPAGAERVRPDFEDAVVVASLAAETPSAYSAAGRGR